MRTRLGKIPNKIKAWATFHIIDAPIMDGFTTDNTQAVRTWYVRDDSIGLIDGASLETTWDYLKNVWAESGPFDGILGFSMGGTVAAIMVSSEKRDQFPGLKFGIFIGAPDVPTDKLGYTDFEIDRSFPSLHVAGKTDNVVIIDRSRALAQRFQDPVCVEHEQGHCIPMKPDIFNAFVEFVSKNKV